MLGIAEALEMKSVSVAYETRVLYIKIKRGAAYVMM